MRAFPRTGLTLGHIVRSLPLVALLMSVHAPRVAADDLVSAVLPHSRSGQVGMPVTVFASVVNATPDAQRACTVVPATVVDADFSATPLGPDLKPAGMAGEAVDLGPGEAAHFVLRLVANEAVDPAELEFVMACEGTEPAASISGINTLWFSAASEPVPDVVAIAVSGDGSGVASLQSARDSSVCADLAPFARSRCSAGAFSAAAMNLGAGADVLVSAAFRTPAPWVDVTVCRTDPGTGACLHGVPEPAFLTRLTTGEAATFSVFVRSNRGLGFDPAAHRVDLEFSAEGVMRGATSIAVTGPLDGWSAWRDAQASPPQLVVAGDVWAPTPCHRVSLVPVLREDDESTTRVLQLLMIEDLPSDLACPQVLALKATSYLEQPIMGDITDVLIRLPDGGEVTIPVR